MNLEKTQQGRQTKQNRKIWIFTQITVVMFALLNLIYSWQPMILLTLWFSSLSALKLI